MKTIVNVSRGRHQVKTLDQGLVFLDPGDSLNAEVERTYGNLISRSLSLTVSEAVEGAEPGLTRAEGPDDGEKSTEQRQNGSGDVEKPADDSTDKAEWAAYATSKGIRVNKSWGVNRIKTELEQLP